MVSPKKGRFSSGPLAQTKSLGWVGLGIIVVGLMTLPACRGERAEPDLPQGGEEIDRRPLDIVSSEPGQVPDSLQPVIVVNGIVMDQKAFERLEVDPSQVHSMDVLKGERATSLVGPEGKNGVVDITLKIPLRELPAWPDSGGIPLAVISLQGRELETMLLGVTADAFQPDRDQAWLGRLFVAQEYEGRGTAVVILSHKLWEDLGGQPQLLGESVSLGGKDRVIIGVLPPEFFSGDFSAAVVPKKPEV